MLIAPFPDLCLLVPFYHTVYKANTRVKEIWFRFAEEIAYRITMKQLVDLSACIYIEIEKKIEKERKMDSISDRLVHIMAKILIKLLV